MIDKSKSIRKNSAHITQSFPKKYLYLTKSKKTEVVITSKNVIKSIFLKNDYIINMIHVLLFKYYTTENLEVTLWSKLLRKKYGMNYNHYVNYLINTGFLTLVSNYHVGNESRKYKMIGLENFGEVDIIKHKVYDKVLLKKHEQEYFDTTFTDMGQCCIDKDIRKKLVEDLKYVDIDFEKAISYLENLYHNGEIDKEKYYKNIISVTSIHENHFFVSFDSHSRCHTNCTILKKHIRKNYLTIDGCHLREMDVKNSQPFFFSLFMKEQLGKVELEKNEEFKRYIESTQNGLIYEEIMDKFYMTNRDEAKHLLYVVLFGKNHIDSEYDKKFKQLYPAVHNFIVDVKRNDMNYKIMSHRLQQRESDFIFNRVVKKIYAKFPHIKLFTVHDSICYQEQYQFEVETIFNTEFRKLLK